jgi:cobalt/nickel transport system permease protein
LSDARPSDDGAWPISALHFDLTDQYHPGQSGLHRLDPRVKVVAAVAFVLAIGLTPNGAWLSFALFLALILSASRISGLGWSFAARRAYIAIPFALAALPLPFTVPGPAVFTVPVLGWTASAAGLIRFLSILLRMWMAVQAAILLTATTRFPDLLWSLGALRVPATLVGIIGFMYRYLFVLADEALRMLRARAARSASVKGNRRPSVRWQGRVAGSMIGSLFLRAIERSERVYAAMCARGYDGLPRPHSLHRMRGVDWAALGVSGIALGAALLAGVRI